MSELYKFNSDANHVKFFKWMWGVDPTVKFKTMCPYFWQYIGSLIIFPFIIIGKVSIFLILPIILVIEKIIENRINRIIEKLILDIENAESEEDYYNIYNSRCWRKYAYSRLINNKVDLDKSFLKKWDNVKNLGRFFRVPTKKSFRKIQDKIMYGWIGKVIGIIIIIAIIFILGISIYKFLHLFTWEQFIIFSIFFGKVLLVIGLFIGILFIMTTLIDKLFCDSWLGKIVFWKPVGNFFRSIFSVIRSGIVMVFDMIGNFYRNQCPMITWEKE